jgi:hypothetical protein
MEKVCTMDGVREYCEGSPVELARDGEAGRLVITAYNEAGFNCTRVDLWDLIQWASAGSNRGLLGAEEAVGASGNHLPRCGTRA